MFRQACAVTAFIIAVCALILVEGETAVRIFKLESDIMIGLDACTGFRPIPGAHGHENGPNGAQEISINNAGFRDIDHTIDKPPGTIRILFLGDSLTESIQVPLEETFWRVMQKRLDTQQANVEILSMGVSSFGTNQELLAYECYGRQYHPDIVMLDFFDGNDVTDNYFRHDMFTPQFSLKDGVLTLDDTYKSQVAERMATRATIFPGILYWLKDNSSFIKLLYDTVQLNRNGQTADPGVFVVNPVFLDSHTPEWENAWDLTSALTGKLAKEVRSDGGKLVVVNIPSREQMQPERVEQPKLYDLLKPDTRMRSIAHMYNLPYIDLYPALLQAQASSPVSWPNDAHWNAFGHEVVAGYLLTELRRTALLK